MTFPNFQTLTEGFQDRVLAEVRLREACVEAAAHVLRVDLAAAAGGDLAAAARVLAGLRRRDRVYLLRVCESDFTAHGGYRWPSEVGAECEPHRWQPEAVCGGGLHGFERGEGDGGLAVWHGDAQWLVFSAAPGDVVRLPNIDGGSQSVAKAKARRARVEHVGQGPHAPARLLDCLNYLARVGHLGAGAISLAQHVGHGATVVGGYRARIVAGHEAQVTIGPRGAAVVGDFARVSAGRAVEVSAGRRADLTMQGLARVRAGEGARATVGDDAMVEVGKFSTVTAGMCSRIVAGAQSLVTASVRARVDVGAGSVVTVESGSTVRTLGECRVTFTTWTGAGYSLSTTTTRPGGVYTNNEHGQIVESTGEGGVA